MDAGGRADVNNPRLRNCAVGHDCEISVSSPHMDSTPVHLDDPALGSALKTNPIARHIRATATEDDAGKHVIQCALECETEDDGGDPGCRQQGLDREIEDIGDDGKEATR